MILFTPRAHSQLIGIGRNSTCHVPGSSSKGTNRMSHRYSGPELGFPDGDTRLGVFVAQPVFPTNDDREAYLAADGYPYQQKNNFAWFGLPRRSALRFPLPRTAAQRLCSASRVAERVKTVEASPTAP